MWRRVFSVWLAVAVLVTGGALVASAQEDVPSISAADQLVLIGTVTVDSAYSEGPGWVVIHADNGQGAPGPVIGYQPVNAGANSGITVEIDTAQATPTLFAMLHVDDGEVGVYEFGVVQGADAPARADDQVVVTPFNVIVLQASEQSFVESENVVIDSVTLDAAGWVVIHADANGMPGPVIGYTPVEAGTTTNVEVELMEAPTDMLWPMLHYDTGAAGEYEFGTVEGADLPVRVGDSVAVIGVRVVPHLRVENQVIMYGDNSPAVEGMAELPRPTLRVASVYTPEPGLVVIHQNADGAPGTVIGFAFVPAGRSADVEVLLDENRELLTPILWPMLHADTGTVGEYEFGVVEGADLPVRVDGEVLTYPIRIAPSIVAEPQSVQNGQIVIESAMIDAPGWLVIHADADGAPGPVIGQAALRAGDNRNVAVQVEAEAAGRSVFPMLHYDTGQAGVYEFGTVEGADPPVRVGGEVAVVNLPLAVIEEEIGEEEEMAPTVCTVTPAAGNVNRRTGPGTGFAVSGQLAFGESAPVDGQATGADGAVWYRLEGTGLWVSSTVVSTEGPCAELPTVEAPAAPQPAATEEMSG